MEKKVFPNYSILWIEDQYEEYDPLFNDLQDLVGKGHVTVSQTEDDGRSLLQNKAFDLVILDLLLPKNENERRLNLIHLEAGIRILQELRNNESWATHRNCKVLVFTARGNPDALAEVGELLDSNGELIEKPTHVEDVIQLVKELLEEIGTKVKR